jgi:hypothetical protein
MMGKLIGDYSECDGDGVEEKRLCGDVEPSRKYETAFIFENSR